MCLPKSLPLGSSAGIDAGIRDEDHAARAADEADAGDDARAVDGIDAVVLMHADAAQGRQFQKIGPAVEQERNALARQQLLALAETLDGSGRQLDHLGLERAYFVYQSQMRRLVGFRFGAVGDKIGTKGWQRTLSPSERHMTGGGSGGHIPIAVILTLL